VEIFVKPIELNYFIYKKLRLRFMAELAMQKILQELYPLLVIRHTNVKA